MLPKAEKAMSSGAVWGTVWERNLVQWTDGHANLGGAGQDRWYRLRHLVAVMFMQEIGVEAVNKKKLKIMGVGSAEKTKALVVRTSGVRPDGLTAYL